MRVAFVGCVQFSYQTLRHLLSVHKAQVCAVVTKKTSDFNSDFCDLTELAHAYSVPVFYAEGNNQQNIYDFLKQQSPDIIFCFGWSYLLRKEILQLGRYGVVGYHPAALPQNRGRHPLIWALVLGLKKSASTFFWMDEGADSGPILHQKEFAITNEDDAQAMYDKILQIAKEQIDVFYPCMIGGRMDKVEQDHSQANYWRKRGREDGKIDFRMTSQAIYNLVRGLTKPYVGAHIATLAGDQKVWKVRCVAIADLENIEPGQVLAADSKNILIKTQDAAIELLEHELIPLPKKGDYL